MKLYVGGLSYDTTDETLKNLFSQIGQVESARVITDRDTGRSRGFGFVEMSTSGEAARAIMALNGSEFEGRNIMVNEARPVAPRDNRGGRSRY